ncbi:hypothetical protein BGZ83_008785 [Gryganskiella cystojenkinii]|nr:hypothetical protein BGZ83_008785 [Gryganskiella cystojenkinii]
MDSSSPRPILLPKGQDKRTLSQDTSNPTSHHPKAPVDLDKQNRTNLNGDNVLAQANGGNHHPPGLSWRERKAAATSSNNTIINGTDNSNNTNSGQGSQGHLSLSISPPSRFTPSSSSTSLHSLAADPAAVTSTNNNETSNGSQDSLVPPPSLNIGQRRASLSLSAGSLSFPPSSSSSMASPSSPSYSTIAVARARAAAAAAEGTTGAGGVGPGPGGEGRPGVSSRQGAFGSPAGVIDSGVFPGPNPFLGSQQQQQQQEEYPPSTQSRPVPHPPLPKPLSSSSSSLLSNTSGTSITSLQEEGPTNHLQENFKAEREISMILPDFLYLGGELVEEEQILELERLGIQRVLNMAENCDDELWIQRSDTSGTSERYLKVGLRDHVDQDLKDGLDKAIQFIASSKTPVYVHCQAGKSRSVATVIGYLIQEHRWPLKRAYDHVVERRRCMSPNIGFVSQLIMLEERVFGRENAGGLVSVAESEEEVDPTSRTTVMPWMT